MNIDKKKLNSILEYALIIILFFIGIKKGGYYKQDSLIGICVIQIISAIFILLNIKDIKKNSILSLFLLIFSISYFIPVLFNATTMSGALNMGIRVYSMYLVFCFVSISENKEKYLKALVIFTTIFAILGIDEISFRALDNILSSVGSGYLDESTGKVSSVLQYANILGILCTVCTMYLLNKIQINKYGKIKRNVIFVIYDFLTIVAFLTQSKMVMLLTIVFNILICIKNNENKSEKVNCILNNIFNIIFAFIVSVFVLRFNAILTICIGIAVFTVYNILRELISKGKNKVILDGVGLVILVIFTIINFSVISESDIITRVVEYFKNFDSSVLRLEYYKDAFKIIFSSFSNFIFGIGGNGFRTAYEAVQSTNYISLEVHSLFVQVFVEAGMIGIISLCAVIGYILKKSENNIYKLMLIALLIFAAFDVFLTYTFMLFVLAVLLGMCCGKVEEVKFKSKILYGIIFVAIFLITISNTIAAVVQPLEVNNINNTLEEQEKVIQRCELSLIFDPYDLEYINNYLVASKTYLEKMDIRKELFGEDNKEKRYEIISDIEDILNKVVVYEKSNKYIIEDVLYYKIKYLDYLVVINYLNDLQEGYITYLIESINYLNDLIVNHGYNELAKDIREEYSEYLVNKYEEVNILLNSEKINTLLESIK